MDILPALNFGRWGLYLMWLTTYMEAITHMKKISVALLSACLLLSTASAVSASAAPATHKQHEMKAHEKKMHMKAQEKKMHTKSHKGKTIKTKATKMPKTGFGGASEQTE